MFKFIERIFAPILPACNGIVLGGYIPDHPDTRDIPFSTYAAVAPKAVDVGVVDLRPNCSPVENQSKLGSCVANAVVGGLELLENLNGMAFVDLARLFLYYNCRAAMGTIGSDSGTQPRLAMQCLAAQGVCAETTWPYDITQYTVRPSWKSYREAFGHKIKAFYRITGTGDIRNSQIEASLCHKNPVVFGVNVYSNFLSVTSLGAPMPSGTSPGRHAMLIVGFNRSTRTFILRNSWGTGFGEDGYCAIPYEWLDACDCQDVWSITGCG